MSTTTHRAPRFAALMLAAGTVAVLSGCSHGVDAAVSDATCMTGTALALVVSVHDGTQAPGVPESWDCALDAAIRDGLPISVVTAEGVPQVILKGHIAHLYPDMDTLAVEDDVLAAKNTVVGAVSSAVATSQGNDLFAAVSLAAALAPGGQVMVLDSGATDSGVVRTTEEGMTTVIDASDVAQVPVDAGSCDALGGVAVELYGIGYQAPPAEPLTEAQRGRLTEIWHAVFGACGADVAAVDLPRTGEGPDSRFDAAYIAREEDPPMPTATTGSSTDARGTTCHTVVPDALIGFVADQATFLDPDNAQQVITEAATHLAGCSGRIEVLATTSSAGTEKSRAALSTERAEAVRDRLADSLDVDPSDIAARGLGYDTDEGQCIDDRVDGVLDPLLAAQNRKVIIRIHS